MKITNPYYYVVYTAQVCPFIFIFIIYSLVLTADLLLKTGFEMTHNFPFRHCWHLLRPTILIYCHKLTYLVYKIMLIDNGNIGTGCASPKGRIYKEKKKKEHQFDVLHASTDWSQNPYHTLVNVYVDLLVFTRIAVTS